MEQFGKYKLERRIGAGGMAEVYLARTQVAQGLNKQLVIKKIHPAFARSRQFVAMFVDEAKIALSLNHPNIVQVFDFGQVGQTFFLAMEYIEGCDVLKVMQVAAKAKKRIPLDIAAYITQQVAKGLDYAHRKTDEYGDPLGIVHRDISPQNALVSWEGAVKIVDFGIARARDVKEEEGVIKGKFAYMAPEQARGQLVDRRADVFATGVVLFELCCGRPLFPGKGKEVLEMAKSGAIPSPRSINPEIPPELEATIMKALAYDRESRFQTTRDLQTALGRFQFQWAQANDSVPCDSSRLAQYLAHNLRNKGPKGTGAKTSGTNPGTPASIAQYKSTADARELVSSPGGSKKLHRELRERKSVFLVHARLSGLKVDKDSSTEAGKREVAEDFKKVAKDIAFKHEALLEDKGDEGLHLTVGVPVAGEDDASRTIRLALALIDALDGIGQDTEPDLRLAVGIERGWAIVTRDKQGRYSHELEGDTVGAAADLANIARGAEVLVTSEVYRVSKGDWNFESISGSRTGTQTSIYRLRGPKEREQRLQERQQKVELIGRDLERKALRDAYRDALINGSHRLLVIAGEPGTGKRTLVNDLIEHLPRGEALVMRATARAATRYTPFGVIADLGRDTMGLAEGAEPREIQRRIEQLATVLWPNRQDSVDVREQVDAACLLFGIRRENVPDLDPNELRARLRRVALRLEKQFAPDAPLIVVGENVHWADEQSMALMNDLVDFDNTRGILVIITSRPNPSVVKLAKGESADIMNLGELDEGSCTELIARRFIDRAEGEELSKLILPRTGGNPYFISEVLDSLVDRGICSEEEGEGDARLRWARRDVPISIPTTVDALLATRIDRLSEELKHTFVQASILGSRFTSEELSGLLERRCDPQLAELVERGLLRKEGQEHAFPNEMTMSVAYRMVPADDRRALHLRAAANATSASSYRKGKDDAVIARHYELAGDATRAAKHYGSAGEHAIQVGSMGEAFYQLGRGLKLLGPEEHAERYGLHLARVEVLQRLGRKQQQRREVEALQQEATCLDDPAKRSVALARLADYHIQNGDRDLAEQALEPALSYARDAKDGLAEAEVLRLMASNKRFAGKNDEALELVDQALAVCSRDPKALVARAQILNNRGTIMWAMDRLAEAIECYAESLVIYRALRMPRLEARALNNMGIVFSALAEPEEALAHYKSSLRIDQRLGDKDQIALKLGNIGQTYTEIGDDKRGEKYLLKALKLTEASSNWSSLIDVLNTLGQVYLHRRSFDRALDFLERAYAQASKSKHHYQEVRSLTYLAMTRLERGGEPDQALDEARRATEIARAMPMPVGEMYGLAGQALAWAEKGDLDKATKLSQQALAVLDAIEQGEGLERILWIHASLCERAGRLDEARVALTRSYEEVEKMCDKLSAAELRQSYLAIPAVQKIRADHERLCGEPAS